jgi:molybdenum cofactor cytidylyltransferase
MRVAAVVLAAGEGRRMGGPKALCPLRDGTFASAVLERFDRADVASRIVVIGAQAERVAAAAWPAGSGRREPALARRHADSVWAA